MKVFAVLPVDKQIAEQFPRKPHLVELCIEEATKALNEAARERGRKVAERPILVEIIEPTFQLNQVHLRFEAETRPI